MLRKENDVGYTGHKSGRNEDRWSKSVLEWTPKSSTISAGRYLMMNRRYTNKKDLDTKWSTPERMASKQEGLNSVVGDLILFIIYLFNDIENIRLLTKTSVYPMGYLKKTLSITLGVGSAL